MKAVAPAAAAAVVLLLLLFAMHEDAVKAILSR
jgi:hypothetical protein